MTELESLTNKLLRLAAWMDSRIRAAVTAEGVTTAQYEVLEFVCECGRVENDYLQKVTRYDRSTLCRLLAKLCKSSLVQRKTSTGRDGRCKEVIVTDKGKEAVERVKAALTAEVDSLLAHLSAKSRSGLTTGLRTIEEAVGPTRDLIAGFGTLWRLPRMSATREAATKDPRSVRPK